MKFIGIINILDGEYLKSWGLESDRSFYFRFIL
jgi:hypothetical protein